MLSYSQEDLTRALRDVGVEGGDNVLFNAQLFALGRLEGASSRSSFLNQVLDSILAGIGDTGTLAVHTYTTQTARFGRPFKYESTPCINGLFPQFILEHPDSLRSLHPVNSFSAIGRRKNDICLGTSSTNYGVGSPPDRMRELDVKVVIAGMDFASCVFMHHLEATMGVPYCYNKLLDVPVIVGGEKLDRWFTANVRYLNLTIEYQLDCLRDRLTDEGIVRTVSLGEGTIHAFSAKEYTKVARDLLAEDPFGLLAQVPNFTAGQIPFDGVAAGRDGLINRERFSGAYDFGSE